MEVGSHAWLLTHEHPSRKQTCGCWTGGRHYHGTWHGGGGRSGWAQPPTAQDPQNGQFWAHKRSNTVLPRNDPGPLGKAYGAYLSSFGPALTRLAPLKARPLPLLDPFRPVLSRFGRSYDDAVEWLMVDRVARKADGATVRMAEGTAFEKWLRWFWDDGHTGRCGSV